MKKSKLSITLVTSFIAAMALTACDNIKASEKAIVSFTPYGGGDQIAIITNDIYNAYRNTTGGVSKFYDKILEVLIRYEFKDKEFSKGELKYADIENWANNQVQEQKDKAKANAKSNKTKYKDEWQSILDSNGVEDADELKEKYIYEKEKEVMKNWYADDDDNAKELKDEFLGIKADGTAVTSDVKAAMPYHIRHILVKVDEAGDTGAKFYKGTVSEAQAKLLSDTVTTLAEGNYTFAQVAGMYSEDGSASSGGDVGIMTNAATSGSLGMVNEFQLGLYAYDNLYDASNKTDAAAPVIKEGLGITDEVAGKLPADVVEVPYEAFVNMGKYAKVDADKEGNKLADGSASLYPRNIVWNKYFNLHNVFVIKNAVKATYTTTADADSDPNEFSTLVGSGAYDASLNGKGFNDEGYLVDEHGNMIIGVRSQYGIHLMVIEKSMYDYAELATYYDTKLPGEDNYTPDSYVGYIQSSSLEDYKKRADDVKSKITSFDATYEYRLYQYLRGQVEITFNEEAAPGLEALLEKYISTTKENNAYKQEEGLKNVWRTYSELLEKQESDRAAYYTTKNVQGQDSPQLTRLVPERIADAFFRLYEGTGTAADYFEFTEEGAYHYYA